ncbi:hypothetical protein MUK70_20895 [Dyadobacter chenwenxiniae]|uniref:Uncharacterized protein n=1 Tax=Dyadobacter chenwenxiniae TaxID=2906456 RepID=A0A9X1PJU4_9BACT|nr:hypothetical protein [Dyadobacter chenwenxiniae]MCF0049191.1 hypothetical protein [Dyadobacter chenwenxiniae]MCF0061700.1 hypothetical protein [Dyadobacter chenwenxiniae]UON86460.1 hypothetical protein MUK70_20895 [Dyadobacter chenwenxiniae]
MAALLASGANVKNESGECGILCVLVSGVWAKITPVDRIKREDKLTKKSLIEIGFAIGSALNQLL